MKEFQSQRIGYGEDAHALGAGRPLIIGGITIPDSPHGPVAHSDGDVLFHALADALLSAFALGDIGLYFPPSQAEFKGLDSLVIIERVWQLLLEQVSDFSVVNLAAVITLDQPKLGPQRSVIQANVAELLNLPLDRVGIGFKTSEGLSPQHIQARVSVLLRGHLRG